MKTTWIFQLSPLLPSWNPFLSAKKQTSHVFQTPFSNRPSFSNRDSKSDLWNSLESEKTQLSSSIKTINGDPKQANKHTHILIVFSRLVDPSTWNRRAFGSCCLFVLFSVIRWSWLLSFLLLICAVKSLFILISFLSLSCFQLKRVSTLCLFEKIPTDKTVHFYFLWQERHGRWCWRFLLEEKSPGNRPWRKVTKMGRHLDWCRSKD